MTDLPFVIGVQDGVRGTDPRLCPFEKLTKEWNEWQRGLVIGSQLVWAHISLVEEDKR